MLRDPTGVALSTLSCVRRRFCAAVALASGAVALIAAGAAPASVTGSGGWKVQKSLNPGGCCDDNRLAGVAATSATNAWAVGYYLNLVNQTLIEHWNGRGWRVQKSPNPGAPVPTTAWLAWPRAPPATRGRWATTQTAPRHKRSSNTAREARPRYWQPTSPLPPRGPIQKEKEAVLVLISHRPGVPGLGLCGYRG